MNRTSFAVAMPITILLTACAISTPNFEPDAAPVNEAPAQCPQRIDVDAPVPMDGFYEVREGVAPEGAASEDIVMLAPGGNGDMMVLSPTPLMVFSEPLGISAYVNLIGVPAVNVSFGQEDGANFARVSASRIGRKLALVRNGVIASAPVVSTEISGSKVEITAGLEMREASDLAAHLRCGAW
jgi:hypothetical protein